MNKSDFKALKREFDEVGDIVHQATKNKIRIDVMHKVAFAVQGSLDANRYIKREVLKKILLRIHCEKTSF